MKKIIAITTIEDSHTFELQECVKKFGNEMLLLQRETYGTEWIITANQGINKTRVIVETQERTYSIEDIGSMWVRRDFTIDTVKKNEDPESTYIAMQVVFHVNGIIRHIADKIPTMNHPRANWIAQSKFHQREIATKVGLLIPETYQGGSPDLATGFCKELNYGRRCLKPLESVHYKKEDGSTYSMFTRIIEETEIATDGESLKICPVIIQQFIEKDYEIRATIVGDTIFASSIDTKNASQEAQIDWRHYDWENTPYYPVKLPKEVEEKLLLLMREIGLVYGACDLIRSKDGDYYFIEVNAQGQWLWIQDLTDLKISEEIANWLIEKSH